MNTPNEIFKQLIFFLIVFAVLYFTGLTIVTAWRATAIDYQRVGQVVEQDRQRNGIEELEGR